MIEQKAKVIQQENNTVWVEAQRQSTCGQCQARKGCGTGMLENHVGKRFSRLSLTTDATVEVGQEVTVAIPEQALLTGAFMMYLLPLILLFITAGAMRYAELGEGMEILAGIAGLAVGFYLVHRHLRNKNVGIEITEESK